MDHIYGYKSEEYIRYDDVHLLLYIFRINQWTKKLSNDEHFTTDTRCSISAKQIQT